MKRKTLICCLALMTAGSMQAQGFLKKAMNTAEKFSKATSSNNKKNTEVQKQTEQRQTQVKASDKSYQTAKRAQEDKKPVNKYDQLFPLDCPTTNFYDICNE